MDLNLDGVTGSSVDTTPMHAIKRVGNVHLLNATSGATASKITNIIKEKLEDAGYGFMGLTGSNWALDSFAVYQKIKTPEGNAWGVIPVVIYKGENLGTKEIGKPGQQPVRLPWQAKEVADSIWAKEIREELRLKEDLHVYCSITQVLNLEKDLPEGRVEAWATQLSNIIRNQHQELYGVFFGEQDPVMSVGGKNGDLSINVTTPPSTLIEPITGYVCYSNLQVTTGSNQRTGNRVQSLNQNGDSDSRVGTISADITVLPIAMPGPPNPTIPGDTGLTNTLGLVVKTQHVTSTDTNGLVNNLLLLSVLSSLDIVSMYKAREINAFKTDSEHPHLGHVTCATGIYQAGRMEKAPLKFNNEQEYALFLENALAPQFTVEIQPSMTGASPAYTLLLEAAGQVPLTGRVLGIDKANQVLFNTLNKITAGELSKTVNPSTRMATYIAPAVSGFWIDPNGQKQPLSSVDYASGLQFLSDSADTAAINTWHQVHTGSGITGESLQGFISIYEMMFNSAKVESIDGRFQIDPSVLAALNTWLRKVYPNPAVTIAPGLGIQTSHIGVYNARPVMGTPFMGMNNVMGQGQPVHYY